MHTPGFRQTGERRDRYDPRFGPGEHDDNGLHVHQEYLGMAQNAHLEKKLYEYSHDLQRVYQDEGMMPGIRQAVDRSASSMRLNSRMTGQRSPNEQTVSQQNRHARRIYVGGIPPSHADEKTLKDFLTDVIRKGLNDDGDKNYILSLYINQRKCFAFVELNSIELTTACLAMDGIVYKNSALRVLRANEYKPELLPSSNTPTLKFELPPALYAPEHVAQTARGFDATDSSYCRGESIIIEASIDTVQKNSIVLIGFPYDEGARRSGYRQGSACAPKTFRRLIHKSGFGSLDNPEFMISLRQVKVFDIGDIPLHLSLEDAHARLAATVKTVLQLGAVPFVLGGSGDQSYHNARGLMHHAGSNTCVVSVNGTLGMKGNNENSATSLNFSRMLLRDSRFTVFPPDGDLPSCEGRLVNFASQGSLCSSDHAMIAERLNAKTLWLSRDLRNSTPLMPSTTISPNISDHDLVLRKFQDTLDGFKKAPSNLGSQKSTVQPAVFLSVHADAISNAALPGSTWNSSVGLSAEEILDICFIAGRNPNVLLFDFSDFNPDIEEYRSRRLVADMFYRFVMGYAVRENNSVLHNLGASTAQSNWPSKWSLNAPEMISGPIDLRQGEFGSKYNTLSSPTLMVGDYLSREEANGFEVQSRHHPISESTSFEALSLPGSARSSFAPSDFTLDSPFPKHCETHLPPCNEVVDSVTSLLLSGRD